MAEEIFDEQDNAFIKDAMKSVNRPYGQRVMIKRWTGVSDPGDPARGIQAKFQYTLMPLNVIVDVVSQQDILTSGGLYQSGDLKITSTMQLNYIDTIQQIGGISQGDRVVYDGHEYRIVGIIHPQTLIRLNVVYIYVLRKIGNASV